MEALEEQRDEMSRKVFKGEDQGSGPLFAPYVRKVEKSWPWWLWPITPYCGPRKMVSCSCGRVMWIDAPERIRRHHSGHRMSLCESASFFYFARMKFGLLDRRTLGEWWQDVIGRLEK